MNKGIKMDIENQAQDQLEAMQYLTFVLAGEEYGINILKVQEIRSYETTTRIPGTPEYLLGVINLRGSVVPIVDLRKKFELQDTQEEINSVTILVKISTQNKESTLGIVVDSVSDVYAISGDDITSAPDIASNSVKAYVTGLATIESKMIILLDIDALINTGILDANTLIGASEYEDKEVEVASQ